MTRGLKNVLMQTSDRELTTLLGTSLPPEEAAVPLLEQNPGFHKAALHGLCASAGKTNSPLHTLYEE